MMNSRLYSYNPSYSNLSQSMKRSIVKVREMSQQEFYNKRFSKMRDILLQRGLELNLVLSEEELLNFLDSLANEQFDRELAQQLFEQIPATGNPNYPDHKFYALQDFIDTHIKAEYLLLLQADETENELARCTSQIDYLGHQLQAQFATNPAAKSDVNSLQIMIYEVVSDDLEYSAPKGSTYSVLVVFNRYKYETDELALSHKEFFLPFNRDFNLKVTDSQESIKILLRDFKQYSSDPNYKDLKCTLTLDRFEDQQVHDEYYYLYDQNNNLTPFKVHAAIQWKHTETNAQQETLETLLDLQGKLADNKESIEASLKALVRPFAKASGSLKKIPGEGYNVTQSSSLAALVNK